jgi:hypothetical protein
MYKSHKCNWTKKVSELPDSHFLTLYSIENSEKYWTYGIFIRNVNASVPVGNRYSVSLIICRSTRKRSTCYRTLHVKRTFMKAVLLIRIGAFFTPGSGCGIRGKEKIRFRDERPRSFFRDLKNGLKLLQFLYADPDFVNTGSGMEKIGSGMFIPDPQQNIMRKFVN